MARKEKTKWEFGDFQTPFELAKAATNRLARRSLNPSTVIEPSCGEGSFLLAAMESFPDAQHYVGAEINKAYVDTARQRVANQFAGSRYDIEHVDFFRFDWHPLIDSADSPILVLGNPPWVTSAELGMLGSENLPEKSNFQGRRGLDAMTGKSNFDISESMLLSYLEWLHGKAGTIAVLCKSSVARKILLHAWRNGLPVVDAEMVSIDAKLYFNASVDACFLTISFGDQARSSECAIFESLADESPKQKIGYIDAALIANVDSFHRWKHLRGNDPAYVWRSGVKHDCSRVMELVQTDSRYENSMGDVVELEDTYLYPMLKSSDLANGDDVRYGRKVMLVTQSLVGEDTSKIAHIAPLTWKYLESHRSLLDDRGSSIYRKRPPFSVFGIGDYSFAPWKVAISGFYKTLRFKVVEPFHGRPVVLDDTSYFLPCWSYDEARLICEMLNSKAAQEFLSSMVFWEEKRPITVELLKRLSLASLSNELNRHSEYMKFASIRRDREAESVRGQLSLGIAEAGGKYRELRK